MLQSSVRALPQGVEITGAIATGYDEILSPDALSFIAKLHRAFESRRRECLQRRQDRQRAFDCGESLDFLTETKHIREGDWSCAPIPRDLQDRRVEITGPTDRKMVSNLEARIWNDAFKLAQDEVGIQQGTVRATVLIETIPAAFEMDEILYELREHSAGLNCGRWDYIFSCIKKFRHKPDFLLADRAVITMMTHFMHSYSLLCIQTCHRRKTFAMGGMAAQIPVKNNPRANEEAFAKVRSDKEREAGDGHDGTWVAHPGMVQLATEAFDRLMPQPNQTARQRDDVDLCAKDLLDFGPRGPITEQGLRTNVSVGVQYLEAWLRGSGAVPIFNLMEDAATAEISRAQVWQWIRHPDGKLSDGRKVTKELFREVLTEELTKIKQAIGVDRFASGKFEIARDLFDKMTTDDEFAEFLTLPGYDKLE